MALNHYETLIRMSELASTKDRKGLLPMSPATIWRMNADPDSGFPKPFKLAPNTTVWRTNEVLEWISSKAKGGSHV
jgi:predicted DNA-binding transcriptional regulator AlpA